MSYLLEALKRIEEQRQDRDDSDLLTSQGRPSRVTRNRALWPYVLSAALLMNAVVAVWLLGPWRTASEGVTAVPGRQGVPAMANPVTPATSPPQARSSPDATEVLDGHGTPGKVLGKEQGNQAQSQKPKEPVTRTLERATASAGVPRKGNAPSSDRDRYGKDAEHGSLSRSMREPARSAEEGVTVGKSVPPTAKPAVSELHLSLHSYSPDPKSRLVRIDERTVGEGDTLATGVVVEEITPDGAVINDKGSRIHLKVQN